MEEKEFLMQIRRALLMAVDAIERYAEYKPRTSKLRKFYKDWRE
jgi:hypothetical protein